MGGGPDELNSNLIMWRVKWGPLGVHRYRLGTEIFLSDQSVLGCVCVCVCMCVETKRRPSVWKF